MRSIIKKSLGIFVILGALSLVFASNPNLVPEQDVRAPEVRQFYPMSLDIFHVTTPHIESLEPYKIQPPENEKDNDIFKGLTSFMSQFVFLQQEGMLWDDGVIYPEVILTTTDQVISKAHAPYEIRLTDMDPITQVQEWYRQKNVALMVDLWYMALGKKSHPDAPCALKKLMVNLGVRDQGPFNVEDSFVKCLDRVRLAHKDYEKIRSPLCEQAFQEAGWHLLKWLDAYEETFHS